MYNKTFRSNVVQHHLPFWNRANSKGGLARTSRSPLWRQWTAAEQGARRTGHVLPPRPIPPALLDRLQPPRQVHRHALRISHMHVQPEYRHAHGASHAQTTDYDPHLIKGMGHCNSYLKTLTIGMASACPRHCVSPPVATHDMINSCASGDTCGWRSCMTAHCNEGPQECLPASADV